MCASTSCSCLPSFWHSQHLLHFYDFHSFALYVRWIGEGKNKKKVYHKIFKNLFQALARYLQALPLVLLLPSRNCSLTMWRNNLWQTFILLIDNNENGCHHKAVNYATIFCWFKSFRNCRERLEFMGIRNFMRKLDMHSSKSFIWVNELSCERHQKFIYEI